MKITKLFLINTGVLFSIFLILGACKTTEPVRPAESYLTPDYNPQPSTISLPLEMDIKDVEKLLNKQLSGLIYEDNSLDNNGGDNLMYKAWKKEDIKIAFNNDLLTYRVPLKLWIKAGWKIEKFGYSISDYREINAEIALKFHTKLTLNPDWSITTQTVSDGYEWLSSPVLKMGPVDVPITYIANLILDYNQKTISSAIDNGMKESLNLRNYAQQAWTDVQSPVNISPEYNLWLTVQPTEALAMPISGKNGKIRQVAAIRSLLLCSIGKQPVVKVNPQLPNLKITNVLADNTVMNLVADIPYTFIDSISRQNLLGKTFSEGKRSITINELSIFGKDNSMIVQTTVSGSINGKLYFSGKPVYNKTDSTIRISDFDFELKTKNALVKSASWLIKGGIVGSVAKRLVYPVGDKVRETQDAIQKNITHYELANGFFLTGKIDHMDLQQLYLAPGSIKAAISIQCKVKIMPE
ncbi:MAG TPA: DUF4403 family protein [Bacteroidales bacterium]